MRKALALVVSGVAAAILGAAAIAAEPGAPQPKPSSAPSGVSKDGASTGSSRDQDERKATESKEKAKKRPGYKDDAPSPRA